MHSYLEKVAMGEMPMNHEITYHLQVTSLITGGTFYLLVTHLTTVPTVYPKLVINWLKFFLYWFKNEIISYFVKFVAPKKVRTTNFPPSFFVVVVGSGMDKSGFGSGISIPDPQH
jgi:hypothetical protein